MKMAKELWFRHLSFLSEAYRWFTADGCFQPKLAKVLVSSFFFLSRTPSWSSFHAHRWKEPLSASCSWAEPFSSLYFENQNLLKFWCFLSCSPMKISLNWVSGFYFLVASASFLPSSTHLLHLDYKTMPAVGASFQLIWWTALLTAESVKVVLEIGRQPSSCSFVDSIYNFISVLELFVRSTSL